MIAARDPPDHVYLAHLFQLSMVIPTPLTAVHLPAGLHTTEVSVTCPQAVLGEVCQGWRVGCGEDSGADWGGLGRD